MHSWRSNYPDAPVVCVSVRCLCVGLLILSALRWLSSLCCLHTWPCDLPAIVPVDRRLGAASVTLLADGGLSLDMCLAPSPGIVYKVGFLPSYALTLTRVWYFTYMFTHHICECLYTTVALVGSSRRVFLPRSGRVEVGCLLRRWQVLRVTDLPGKIVNLLSIRLLLTDSCRRESLYLLCVGNFSGMTSGCRVSFSRRPIFRPGWLVADRLEGCLLHIARLI